MKVMDYGDVKKRLYEAVEESYGSGTSYRMGKLAGMVTVYHELGIISSDESLELLTYFLDLV